MDRLSEGYKRAIDNVWGPIKRIFGSKSEFLGPPKKQLLILDTMF